MFPYLFKIGFFELRVYSLMYIIGLLLTIYFARKKGEQMGIKPVETENFILFTFFFALIGARMYYVAFRWGYYDGNIMEMAAIWHGGLAIHGGIIAGFMAALIFCRYKKIKPLVLGDIVFPFLLLAQGIGRIGNLANGEAHGVPTLTPPSIIFRMQNVFPEFWAKTLHTAGLQDNPKSVSLLRDIAALKPEGLDVSFHDKIYHVKEYFPWGMSFTNKYGAPAYRDFGTLPVHPTFIYEMVLNFTGFFILYLIWRKNENIGKGIIAGGYLIAYGIIRACVTFFRADDLMIGLFRAPHLISAFMVAAGAGFLINARISARRKS
jgi:phosphatidylglycerol:prolipoprotein diacylglycerol transferase